MFSHPRQKTDSALTPDGQEIFIMSLALSFTVIGLEQFLYTAPVQFQEAPGSGILSWACDSLIALPLFVLGVWAAQRIAGWRGIGVASRADLLRRSLLTAASLAVVLIPGWFAHNWLNNLTQSEPLVPVHVHGKVIGANVHWVNDPVVFALLLIPLLGLAGWGGYLIAARVRFRIPRAADVAARAALIAASIAAAPAVAWFLQKAADRSNSAQVYYTGALLSVHVHTHVLFKDGRAVTLPKGPPVIPAPYAFAYQVAHAFQDGLAGMAIGLPVAVIAFFWLARRLRARDQQIDQQVPIMSLGGNRTMSSKGRMSRRTLMKVAGLAGAGAAIRIEAPAIFGSASASVNVPQTPLDGSTLTKWVAPLPTFNGRRAQSSSLQVGIYEFQQKVLPDSVYASLPAPFNKGTYLWGYGVGAPGAAPNYPGLTVEQQKGSPTTITYVNNLPTNPVLRNYLTYDQTIHWADPLNTGHTTATYTGPIPTVVHLHGGEDQSTSDGVPEAWFTNNGLHGKGYATFKPTAPNAAVYNYPNRQQATTLWFHDHTLGITRLNVYSGLVAFYFLRDQYDTGLASNPLKLPAGNYEVELMLQDRQFDTNGQLLFPDSNANPSPVDGPPSNPNIHPYWIPEFFGDVNVVNGRAYPFLKVEPRRYRFRFVNGANARFYRMGLVNASSGAIGPPMYIIGNDGGLLDTPVKMLGQTEPPTDGTPSPTTRLFIAPSERLDVIIDFSGLAGKTLTLTNDGNVPFPSGDPLDPADPTREVMQFQVTLPLHGTDTSYNPATGAALRGGRNQEPKIVRLANPTTGALAAGVTPYHKRQLVLFEFEDPFGNNGNTAGTPVIDVINNTKWNGRRDGGGNQPVPGSGSDQFGQGLFLTELPRIGSTEVWEFLNTTVDAHPIHIHLIQFQLINRQAVVLDPDTGQADYLNTWAAAFPGGTFNGEAADGTWSPITYQRGTIIPGYGPPLNYFNENSDGALGGNPAFSPHLTGPVIPPNPHEIGWKDTVKTYPGYVNRFVIRWAPQATAVNGVSPGQNQYSFDPTVGPAYMVHCHILDHEDNEMMRPYIPVH